MRLAEFKARLDQRIGEESRVQQSSRIDAKMGELADRDLGSKYGLMDARSPDQQDRLTATRTEERNALLDDPKLRTRAAIATGDIAPKDAAQLTMKDDAALWKLLWEKEKEDRRDSRFSEQQDRIDARQSKQLAAQFDLLDRRLAKMGEKDTAAAVQSTHTDGNGYLIAVMRDGSTRRMTDPEGNPVTSQSFEQRVDRMVTSLRKDGGSQFRKMTDEDLRNHVRKTLVQADGVTKPASQPPAAPAAAPSAAPRAASPVTSLPPGSRQVGTSNGKPVYETPDGKRFIGQ